MECERIGRDNVREERECEEVREERECKKVREREKLEERSVRTRRKEAVNFTSFMREHNLWHFPPFIDILLS